jgi:tryptophan halogenase
VNNCVAIGLSSCFLEPLESTGIFFSEFQLASLVSLFPDRRMAEPLRRAYNDAVRACYEETRDFIVMHFVLTDRDDTPYWRAVRNETKVPDTLQERLELFQECLPTMLLRDKFGVFKENNYACILTGMDQLPARGYPLLDHVDARAADQLFADVKERTRVLLEGLPTQYEYLTGLHYKQA